MVDWSRREALSAGAAMAAALAFGGAATAAATTKPPMTTYRDPNCGCCGKWIDLARAAGFKVNVMQTGDLAAVKARLGVPDALASCHTSHVGGYVVEGHVPFAAIDKLLRTKPKGITGISVPGMPAGSPGMEAHGDHGHAHHHQTLKVVAFTRGGPRGDFSY